jgi:hypothetical protein
MARSLPLEVLLLASSEEGRPRASEYGQVVPRHVLQEDHLNEEYCGGQNECRASLANVLLTFN